MITKLFLKAVVSVDLQKAMVFRQRCFAYFIEHKLVVVKKLNTALSIIKAAEYGEKEVLSDIGDEFASQKVQGILCHHGVRKLLIMPYTHKKNGCLEKSFLLQL